MSPPLSFADCPSGFTSRADLRFDIQVGNDSATTCFMSIDAVRIIYAVSACTWTSILILVATHARSLLVRARLQSFAIRIGNPIIRIYGLAILTSGCFLALSLVKLVEPVDQVIGLDALATSLFSVGSFFFYTNVMVSLSIFVNVTRLISFSDREQRQLRIGVFFVWLAYFSFFIASCTPFLGFTFRGNIKCIKAVLVTFGSGFVYTFISLWLVMNKFVVQIRQVAVRPRADARQLRLLDAARWLERARTTVLLVTLACAAQEFILASVPLLQLVVPAYQLAILIAVAPLTSVVSLRSLGTFGTSEPAQAPLRSGERQETIHAASNLRAPANTYIGAITYGAPSLTVHSGASL